MCEPKVVTFRALRREDVPLLYRWFKAEHVARWWPTGSYEEVLRKYGERTSDDSDVRPYVISYGGRPIGYVQLYPADAKTRGLDFFIGEPEYLRRGLSAIVLRAFLDSVVFSQKDVEACIVDPVQENTIAIRAFEKAGFRFVKIIRDPESGKSAQLMAISRSALQSANANSAHA